MRGYRPPDYESPSPNEATSLRTTRPPSPIKAMSLEATDPLHTIGGYGPRTIMSRTYCVSVRDRSKDLLNIKHTDGFKLNGVGPVAG